MLYISGKQFTDAMNEINESFAQLTARVEKLEKQVKEGKENASKKTRPKAS